MSPKTDPLAKTHPLDIVTDTLLCRTCGLDEEGHWAKLTGAQLDRNEEARAAADQPDSCPACHGTAPEHRQSRPERYGGGLCMNPYHGGHVSAEDRRTLQVAQKALAAAAAPPIWSETAPTEEGWYPVVLTPKDVTVHAVIGQSPASVVEVVRRDGFLRPDWGAREWMASLVTILWGPRITLPEPPPAAPEKPAPAKKSGSGVEKCNTSGGPSPLSTLDRKVKP